MGNSQSNSINDNVNQILQESVTSSSDAAKVTPVEIKFKEDARPKNKFVNTETDAKKGPAPQLVTKEAPKTGTELSGTSSAAIPTDVKINSPTSVESTPKTSPKRSPKVNMAFPKKKCDNLTMNVIVLSPEVFKTPESSPKMKGGYSYAAEMSELNNNVSLEGGDKHVPKNIITLDSNIFATSEMDGGEQDEKKQSTEFNPEQFFNEMQQGGERKNKEYKKGKIERYLDPDSDEDESGFDFGEATEGLEIDENEDTEDIKQKVKVLRSMVSRSKAKKGKKGKKGSKKSKRMTSEQSGGSENSVSEYLNSTSSISTSDVRLISMNKMRQN